MDTGHAEQSRKGRARIVRQGIIAQHIISIGVKSTHVEEKVQNHEEYHMPSTWMETPLQMLEINWSGQSLIRSYHSEESEVIHTWVEADER